MKKLLPTVAFVCFAFTLMSLQQLQQQEITAVIDDKEKSCVTGAGQTAPFWKRTCHDCKVHFNNWTGRSTSTKS